MWNGNRAANGMEAFAFKERDVEIAWQFKAAFGLLEEEDAMANAAQNARGINNSRETSDGRAVEERI